MHVRKTHYWIPGHPGLDPGPDDTLLDPILLVLEEAEDAEFGAEAVVAVDIVEVGMPGWLFRRGGGCGVHLLSDQRQESGVLVSEKPEGHITGFRVRARNDTLMDTRACTVGHKTGFRVGARNDTVDASLPLNDGNAVL